MWIIPARLRPARRQQYSASTIRPLLESLEGRCLPSVMSPAASIPPAAVNTIASLPHDQIHVLQDQSQQQTAMATLRLEVEEVVLGLLQEFAPQVPQFQPLIASLTAAIPVQQATVQTLQMQSNLLNQLDDLQDQSLILNAEIQSATALIPVLQQMGNDSVANALTDKIFADQATVRMLQPQIAAVEVEVSAFV